jgi:hypothetical protein
MVTSDESPDDAKVLADIITALRSLSPESRKRVMDTVDTFFRENVVFNLGPRQSPVSGTNPTNFSESKPISPKQFMVEKEPRTDVERVACLAYYLTHYAETPHFKTVDLSRVNTDAAQPKFSNPFAAVDNATKYGYLVPVTKGLKQLSAAGERFVQALPDRTLAKEAMNSVRARWRRRNVGKKLEEA